MEDTYEDGHHFVEVVVADMVAVGSFVVVHYMDR